MDHSESEYFMRRAKEEARLALRSEKPEVAAAHHGLSVEYSARARNALSDVPQPRPRQAA